jgi:hypothetical protein
MNKIPIIESQQPTAAPAWAVLQRQLIRTIDEAVPIFLEKYTRPNGEIIWRQSKQDGDTWADDFYEAFFNWPLFYALGGGQYSGSMAARQWDVITRQLEFDYDQVTNEFVNDADWFHHGENYIYLYYLGLANPTLAQMELRARRFAGYYIGEDAQVRNYDPQFRIIPSPFTGGKGPLAHFPLDSMKYHLGHIHTTLGPGFELPENWFDDDGLIAQVRARYDDIVMRGDIPVNLSVTALVTHAYLYTGEDKYRDWIVEYTEAWMERMEENGGIIPDNVGPSGRVGELRQGQWWGGFYGWTCRFSPYIVSNAITIAAQCAHLVTGDKRYLQFLRSHLDMLLDRSIEEDGKLLVPTKHTDDGWQDFAPLGTMEPIHLWATSMEERDWARLERLRRGNEESWRAVQPRGPRTLDDRAWTRFLAGDFPEYPEQILQANYSEVCRRLDAVIHDEEDLSQVDEHHWQERNPVVTEALVHLTTGGPQTVYWGGLAQGRVRYFDVEKKRPGLAEDTAALVTGLEADRMDLTLVNLSAGQRRQILIGAGSFGEHQFDTVEVVGEQGCVEVSGAYLQVDLQPASQIDLRLNMKRFCNKPSYAFPF